MVMLVVRMKRGMMVAGCVGSYERGVERFRGKGT